MLWHSYVPCAWRNLKFEGPLRSVKLNWADLCEGIGDDFTTGRTLIYEEPHRPSCSIFLLVFYFFISQFDLEFCGEHFMVTVDGRVFSSDAIFDNVSTLWARV